MPELPSAQPSEMPVLPAPPVERIRFKPHYQLKIMGQPAAPVREYWVQAAQDAIDKDVAFWLKKGVTLRFKESYQSAAMIARVDLGKPETTLPE